MKTTQPHISPTSSHQLMKNRILLTFVFALLSLQVFGSHMRGMSVWYEASGTNTILVHNQYYYECTGAPVIALYTANITGVGTGCVAPVATGSSATVSLTEITPLCPAAVSSCVNNSTFDLYGVIESHTTQEYNISGLNCAEYDIFAQTCCRNSAIQNLVNSSSGSGTALARVTLAGLQAGNSGPAWDKAPVFYLYDITRTLSFDQSATDPDGDSLVYKLDIAYSGSGVPFAYSAGYSATSPFGANWQVDVDPELGILTIEPLAGATAISSVVVIAVEEYRNGVLLGTYSRDMNILAFPIAPAASVNPPTLSGLLNPSGGALVFGDTLLVPPGASYCVDFLGNDIDPGDISNMTAYFTGDQSYTFSDPGMTMFNEVVGPNPTGRFCATAPTGIGSDRLVIGIRDDGCGEQGMTIAEFTIIYGDTGLVWPGDANDDLIANVNDLLALGLSYGNTGPARTAPTNNWVGQFAFPWLDTIQGAVDFKHQDCNGSGIVNDDDTLAIVLNYGLTHNKTGGVNGGPNDPPLRLIMPNDSAMVGDTIHAEIHLGDGNNMVSNAYGIAFTLNYDATLIDSNSFYITFDNNWIGSAPSALDLSINMHTSSRCDAAFVRTDHQSSNGMGRIGTAHFIIIDNIDGKRNTLIADTLPMNFSNVNLIGLDGEEIPVNAMDAELIVTDESVDLTGPGFDFNVKLYPNPARELVTLEAGGYLIESLEMLDLQGKKVLQQIGGVEKMRLPLQGIAPGLYFLNIKTEAGSVVRKLLVE